MKKFFALLAVVLAVVSCQKDVDVDVNLSGDLATISVVLPEDAITRANWNGNDSAQGGLANTSDEVVRVIMHIYDDQGRVSDKRYVDYLAEGETTVTFDVRLVPNRQYTFVAWADMVNGEADDDKYFNTKDLRNVTMIEGTWDAMNEERDAFTATYTTPKDKPYTSSSNISLTLTRPFAKLRVVTNDMLSLNHLDIDPTIASVIYSSKHYQAFDAVSGKAINKADVAGVEHRKFTIKSYGEDWEHGADMTLFTDYFFAADGQEEVNFSLEVFDQNNRSIKYNNFNTPIPVKRNNLTTIAGNILTEGNNVTVTVDPVFAGKQDVVGNDSAAQTALDYAIANTTIYLEPGVDYGTLYIRPVAGAENTTSDCDYLVYRNELLRKVENLTIVGAEGATVDAIKVVAGYVKDSGSTGYVVDIKNLVIDSVEFTDVHTNAPHKYAAPIFFDLTYTNVDGLTVKNCKLEGDNAQLNFVYVYGSGNPDNSTFETAAKNITITNNTVDGIARLCELRQTENVTITNNTIKNTYLHGMLLTVDNGTYSGDVTITGNYAEGINERFVRMAGAGDAKVVIKDNTIVKYYGKDADYIKVTDANNLTVEKNYFSVGVKTADALATAIANANAPIVLGNDIEVACDTTFEIAAGKTVDLDLNGYTISATSAEKGKNFYMFQSFGALNVKNGTILYEHKGENMMWNNCTSIFYAGGNGTLNLDGVTAKNNGGSDMAYVVDMTNAQNINVNIENSTLESTYIAVRVFNNSNTGVNNVDIKNTTLEGKYCFWVQYWLADGRDEATLEQTLNINIYNQGNTFTYSGASAVIYGFDETVYADKYGVTKKISADGTVVTLGTMVENGVVARGFAGTEENTTIKKVIVGEGISTLYDRTFRRFYALETVELPSTLTTIGAAGSGVFQSCTALKNIVIPESVTVLGKGSFQECSSLQSINIPAGVTRIEENCLRATGLVSVEFHEGVTYFGAQSFRDCKQLKEVYINAPKFTVEANAFGVMAGTLPGTTIYVANAEMKAYLESTLSYANQFTIVAPSVVDNAEDLTEALAKGENVTLSQNVNTEAATPAPYGNKYAFKQDGGVIDGNGHELYMECYGDDYGIMTSGGTIKNLTITEGCRAVMIMSPQQDVVLDNVKIGGDGVLYPINTGEGGAEGVNLIVTNSTLAGWTSYSLIESATFTNVEFKQGTYYNNIYGRVLKPYVNTTLTNCSFVEHMNLDLSALNAGHKIVMKNCTVNGQAVTAEVFTIPSTDAQYDTELFTVDLPSWASSINDCVVFE